MAVTEPEVVTDQRTAQVSSMIYILLGLLEILLAFRFVFLLLGANPNTGFVQFIYGLTDIFVAPFYGIFSNVTTKGDQAPAVFDPATLVAMLVYALIVWLIVRMMVTMRGGRQDAGVATSETHVSEKHIER